MTNVDMIGYCVMGDEIQDDQKTFKTFDGEFEGLTPLDHLRQPQKFSHPEESWLLSCNYESMFKDEPPIDDAIEKVLELATPKQVTTLDPASHNIDKEKLAKFVQEYDESILNFTDKGPDYLIIDNFLEHFGLDNAAIEGAKEVGGLLA